MNRFATLSYLPFFVLVACETTELTKPRHLSSTRGLQAETGTLGNKALVRESDPKVLTKYKKVIIEDVRVVQPRQAPENVTRANRSEAEELAERFEEILREELRPYYQITRRRGRNTLAVRATLTDLQPSKPGVFVFNYLPYAAAVTTGISVATGKTPGAGSTTVEAEVVDASSRRQIYAIVDQFDGSKLQPGGLEKWGQTEAAMRTWSRKIRKGIQGATPATGATSSTSRERTSTRSGATTRAKSSTRGATPTREKSSPRRAASSRGETSSRDAASTRSRRKADPAKTKSRDDEPTETLASRWREWREARLKEEKP